MGEVHATGLTMAKFTVTKTIAAPIERVFAAASDFPNAAKFIQGIKKVEMLTEGKIGVGTRFRETRVMFKREATETMEVSTFEPPRSYTLGCTSHGCRYATSFTLEPRGKETEVQMRFDATPLTFMAKVLGVIFAPMMKSVVREITKDLDDLKAHCEQARAATA